MSFLPDVKVPCDVCHGAALQPETLAVTLARQEHRRRADRWRSTRRSSSSPSMPNIAHPLQLLKDVGPGLPDARPAVADAVGRRGAAHQARHRAEQGARRRHAARQKAPHTLYVLDEPTVGLHMADVEQADPRAAPAGRRRPQRGRDRARPRRDRRGRLGHRPRARRRRGRRRASWPKRRPEQLVRMRHATPARRWGRCWRGRARSTWWSRCRCRKRSRRRCGARPDAHDLQRPSRLHHGKFEMFRGELVPCFEIPRVPTTCCRN